MLILDTGIWMLDVFRFHYLSDPEYPLDRQLNIQTAINHFVIPAKAGIQYFQVLSWIPALRFAQPAPVQTGGRNDILSCQVNNDR